MDGGVGEGGSALGGGEGSRDRSSMCALKERDLKHQMGVAAYKHKHSVSERGGLPNIYPILCSVTPLLFCTCATGTAPSVKLGRSEATAPPSAGSSSIPAKGGGGRL